MQRYMEGEIAVMPVERDFDFMPAIRTKPVQPEEVAALETPPSAPAEEALAELEAKRAAETASRLLKEKEAQEEAELAAKALHDAANDMMTRELARDFERFATRYAITPKPDRPASSVRVGRPLSYNYSEGEMYEFQRRLMDSMHMGDYLARPPENPDHQPYKGSDRVKLDVRLHERQVPEAMSAESKVFKDMIKRGVEKDLLKALAATEGMGLLKEDWQVLRQSLIEMLQEQARIYYRERSLDEMNDERHATVTFEIPKMTLSFRMPVDRFPRED